MAFPQKKFQLNSALAPEEIMQRLNAEISQSKEFSGVVSGHEFSIHNKSKLPSEVKGNVIAGGQGSVINVVVRQHKNLTLGEIGLLVLFVVIALIAVPDFMSKGSNIAMLVGLMAILYAGGFFGEVEQARNFLQKIAGGHNTGIN